MADFRILNLWDNKNAEAIWNKKGNLGVSVHFISADTNVCVYPSLKAAIKNDTDYILKMKRDVCATVLSYCKDGNVLYVKIQCGSKQGYVRVGRHNVSTYGQHSIDTNGYSSSLGYPKEQENSGGKWLKISNTRSCIFLNTGGEINEDACVPGSLKEDNLNEAEEDEAAADTITATDASISASDGTTTGESEIDVTYEFQLTNVGTFYYNIGDFLYNSRTTTDEN